MQITAEIIKSGEVYTHGYNAWPSITKMDNGKVAAVWSGGRENHLSNDGNIYFSVASENDLIFNDPVIIEYYDNFGARDAGIAYLGDGRIMVTSFYNTSIPGYDSKKANTPFYHFSDNYGITWNTSKEIPIMAPHGPLFVTNNIGSTIFYLGAVPLFNKNGIKNDDGCSICCYVSYNRGETWTKKGTVKRLDWMHLFDFIEPNVTLLPNGTFFAGIRFKNNGKNKNYYNSSFFFSSSEDEGETWSLPVYSGINGTPPHLLVHSSGAIICTFGRRLAPLSIRAIISVDNCISWSQEFMLAEEQINWDFGYPCSVELEDKSILTIYYGKRNGAPPEDNYILFRLWRLN